MVIKGGKKRPAYISPTYMLCMWGYGFVQQFFPPQGWLFLWSYLAIGFYSSIMTRSPALFLFLAMSTAGALNILYRFTFSPRLKVRRLLPSLTSVNTPFTVTYELENTSIFPAYDVTLEPFLRIKELETGSRKRYSFKGREKRSLTVRFLLKKRGIYVFPRPGAETSFPFGLFRKSFSGAKEDAGKAVAVAPLPALDKWNFTAGGARNRRGGVPQEKRKMTPRKKRGSQTLEFAGLREYTPGDEIRHIHFPSSARKGELVMKDFQEEEKEHFLVILDPFFPEADLWRDSLFMLLSLVRDGWHFSFPEKEREALFERSLELAYGAVGAVREQLHGEVDFLWTDGEEVHFLRDAGEGKNFSYLLPLTLAGIRKVPEPDRWRDLSSILRDEDPANAVFIAPFSSEEGEALIKKLLKGSWKVEKRILSEKEKKDD